ncbi:MAG: VPS10 domain-containing protein [Candidatus Kapaibacteriota bacterium]
MKTIRYILCLFILFVSTKIAVFGQIEQIIGITDSKYSVMRDHFYKQNPKYAEHIYGSKESEYLRIEQTDKNLTHFKRWENFWANRLMPDGTFPSSELIINAINQKQQQRLKQKKYEQLFASDPKWSLVGPIQTPNGGGNGRINCITVHPNLTNLIWVGSAAGGAWKSTDFGDTWNTTCDDLFSMGVSDIAMPWDNPNIVYLATGDDDAGCTYSTGILKSTDAGKTWNPTELSFQTSSRQQIYRLLAHPTQAGKLYAATSQGLYITTNAGVKWEKKTPTYNFRDLEIRPGSDIMIGCVGRDIYRSTDAGNTWTKLTTSIPSTIGRISLAISPANPDYMYALCSDNAKQSGFGGLYRSVDGGKTWVSRSTAPNILSHSVDGSGTGGQGWYDLTIACSYSVQQMVGLLGLSVLIGMAIGVHLMFMLMFMTWSISLILTR